MDEEKTKSSGETARHLSPLWWLMALVAGAWIYPRTPLTEWILCPFRWLTELRCAGCGMTRSVTHLVSGDWAAAWGFHPGGPLLVFAMSVVGLVRISDWVAQRKVGARWRERMRAMVTPVSLVLIAMLMALWVRRLVEDVPQIW